MVSAEDIKKKEFSKAGMSGYKKIEVDVFLDEIVNTINYFTATAAANEKKIADYELKLNEYKEDEQAIKSALVNAQRVGEQIKTEAQANADDILFKANAQSEQLIADAKEQSSAMLAEAKEKADLIMTEAQSLSKELSEKTEKLTRESLDNTKRTCEAMKAAAADAVKQQQSLFDALKVQVAMFKRDILKKYEEQTLLVSNMPDEIEQSPELAAETAANTDVDEPEKENEEESLNEIERIINEMRSEEEQPIELVEEQDEAVTETEEQPETPSFDKPSNEKPAQTSGFTVNYDFDDDDDTDESDTANPEINENAEQMSFITGQETEKETKENTETHFVFSGDISDAEQ